MSDLTQAVSGMSDSAPVNSFAGGSAAVSGGLMPLAGNVQGLMSTYRLTSDQVQRLLTWDARQNGRDTIQDWVPDFFVQNSQMFNQVLANYQTATGDGIASAVVRPSSTSSSSLTGVTSFADGLVGAVKSQVNSANAAVAKATGVNSLPVWLVPVVVLVVIVGCAYALAGGGKPKAKGKSFSLFGGKKGAVRLH